MNHNAKSVMGRLPENIYLKERELLFCLPVYFFLPSSAVTMQFSQAPQTTNPSTSACTEKQQPTAAILKGKERITPEQTVA